MAISSLPCWISSDGSLLPTNPGLHLSLASETLHDETQPHASSKGHTTVLSRSSTLVFASGPLQSGFLCLDCPAPSQPPSKLQLLFKNLQWLPFPRCILLHSPGQHQSLPPGSILFKSDYIAFNHKISLHFIFMSNFCGQWALLRISGLCFILAFPSPPLHTGRLALSKCFLNESGWHISV